ncbi:MAG: BamA/TamA family outer membrane protein [Chlamydiota bacterium]
MNGFADLSYKIEYIGIEDSFALKMIKSNVQLNTLQKTLPDSIQALRYRAESDIPEIIKILHSQGYYEACVQIRVEERSFGAMVFVMASLGPAYTISSFNLSLFQGSKDRCLTCEKLQASDLGIKLGSRIQAIKVIDAELKALEQLSQCGYPLALIANRSVVADGDTKTVSIRIEIDSGPLSHFGPLSITGSSTVKPLFFEQRIEWKPEDIYSAHKVDETQKILTDTGLFSSVSITHKEPINDDNALPMNIDVTESKHKSIYAGVSYQTYYGPGLTFGWEHRNIQGLGRRLSLQGDITKRSHVGVATYLIPNFLRVDQDYVWQGQANHLDILPYSERSYQVTNRLERRFSKKLRMSFGLEGERLFVDSSAQNGEYWILEVPIFLGLNGANNLLNPTKGINFEYKVIPAFAFSPDRSFYLTQKLSFCHYLPVDRDHILTIAQKISGGTILSGREEEIPVPRRFFGGSEEELRGYAYYSVSPLNKANKPIGGRSALYYTLETRLRMTKTIGVVPFFDMGNVTENQLFIPSGKWLKSVGCGVRYFSFIGPFRLDIGFPLNPRKGIDKKFRILISVGQSF